MGVSNLFGHELDGNFLTSFLVSSTMNIAKSTLAEEFQDLITILQSIFLGHDVIVLEWVWRRTERRPTKRPKAGTR